MEIGSWDIGEQVLVVAEAGNNHEGDFGRARELVDAAAESGAHAVKFQTFKPEHMVSRLDERRFEQLSRFALTYDQFAELAERARGAGLIFMSTPFDLASVEFLAGVADGLKIASGDNDFGPLLRAAAATDLPLVVSTGLSGEEQVGRTVGMVEEVRTPGEGARLALLQCTSAYPAQPEFLNLAAISTLQERFGHPVGYSDHSLGIEAAVLAVAAGARIVEKHFTLGDTGSGFRDHALSAEPDQMRELVERIAAAEQMLGDGVKRPQPPERDLELAARRSVAAVSDLEAGSVLAATDLTWVRPAGGIPPDGEDRLIGRSLRHSVAAGQQVVDDDVEAR